MLNFSMLFQNVKIILFEFPRDVIGLGFRERKSMRSNGTDHALKIAEKANSAARIAILGNELIP